jgi:hypothetical protein
MPHIHLTWYSSVDVSVCVYARKRRAETVEVDADLLREGDVVSVRMCMCRQLCFGAGSVCMREHEMMAGTVLRCVVCCR